MTKNLSAAVALLCLGLLTACSRSAPTEQDVSRGLGTRCTLVSHEAFVNVSEDARGLRLVSTRFQADCTPESGITKRRIAGTMFFDQWQDWFSKSWSHKSTELDVDRLAARAATTPDSASSRLTYSDGPECNAKLERVATNVLDCLSETDPKSAQYLFDALEQFKHHSRLFGGVASENLALIELEDRCMQQLSIVLRQLPTDERTKACLAKQ
ncbi:MAG: hypothetical protein ACRC2H_11555 [Silanimonas sp.]